MTTDNQLSWQALVAHFGAERLNGIASSRRRYAAHLRPDLQVAITAGLEPFVPRLIGVHQTNDYEALTLSRLTIRSEQEAVAITPLQYQDIDIGEAEPFPALNTGLWLFRIGETPAAVLVSQYIDHFATARVAQVEIAYLPDDDASQFAVRFLRQIQAAGESSKLYRGKVLSFESGSDYSGMRSDMLVHKLPSIGRDDVILGAETMARLDQHVFAFDRHRAALKALGQSTRKGLLLYGPPGTGKTHVINYVSSSLSDHTTVLITAEQVRFLTKYMTLARTLQPSIVVLEDVDLVGRSRESMNANTEVLLNRLLNEMDGLGAEAEILFILTTNRPDDIEDALASRPGRIDEAIEIPLPDASCRERLLALYGKALVFQEGAVAEAVARSDGASAAFMKEMTRRLAQRCLARDSGNQVSSADVAAVFGDAAFHRSRMSRRIVGFVEGQQRARPADDCCG